MEEDKRSEISEPKPKMMRLVGKVVRFCVYTVLSLIALNAILYLVLSIPFVQQTAIDYTIKQLKSMLKTEASVGEIRLSLFDHVQIKDLYVEDQSRDTLLYAGHLDARLSPWELIKDKKVVITSVTLDNFVAKVNRQDSASNFNFQFIIDTFASGDTLQSDTTRSNLLINIRDINLRHGRVQYDVWADTALVIGFDVSHIAIHGLNANIDIGSVDVNNLDIALNSLSAKDQSGLEITSLSGHIYSSGSRLWVENLALSLPNSHLIAERAAYDMVSSKGEVMTHDAEIDGGDLEALLPNLKFLTEKIYLTTDLAVQLPIIDLKELNIHYGQEALLEGIAFVSSYDEAADGDVNVQINKFRMSPKALTDFARLGDSTFATPTILRTMGDVFMKGKVSGQLSRFDADVEIWSKQGAVNLQVNGSTNNTFSNIDVKSKIGTSNFNLNKLMGEGSALKHLTARIGLDVQQTKKQGLSAQVRGVVSELGINEEVMKDLYFMGSYDAQAMDATIYRNSKNGTIFANASMTQTKVPDVSIELRLDSLNITRIYPNENWVNPLLSLRLKGDIHSLNTDDMTGHISLDSLNFRGDNFRFAPGPILLDITRQEGALKGMVEKDINLSSSLLSANIHGNYNFTTLPSEFSNIMHKCLPSIFTQEKKIKGANNDFSFTLTANNSESYSKIFALPIDIIKPFSISGHVNTMAEQLKVLVDIPQLRYNDINASEGQINITNEDSIFTVRGKIDVLTKINNYRLALDMNGGKDEVHSMLKVVSDSADLGLTGNIETLAMFERNEAQELVSTLQTVSSDVDFGKLKLTLLPAKIVNVGDRTSVSDFGINVNQKDFFGAEGVISSLETDSLKLHFANAQIGDLLRGIDINNYDAELNGDIIFSGLLGHPELYIYDFMIQDIIVKGNNIGTVNVASEWSDNSNTLEFEASLQKNLSQIAQINGKYRVKSDSMNVKIHLYRFGLDWLEPYTEGVFSKLKGNISSDLMISGTPDKPQIEGFLGFNETILGIDYTNVVYTISDTIRVHPDKIGFSNLTLKDDFGNTGQMNANITHKDFKDIKMTLDMNLDKLLVLNTMHQTDSLFYGRIFASGKVNIKGDKNKIDVNMQINNEKNSQLNILIPQISEANDYKSVVYINTPKDSTLFDADSIPLFAQPIKPPAMPVKLNVVLTINPNMALGVVIDPTTGDAMDMKGNGNINFTYDMDKNIMATYGRYVLTNGNVKFNLQNIKKLDFNIREGSNLSFIGDPFKTTFDIVAYRRLRADLKSLDYSFESESSSTRVQVDCELGISGDMKKMDLSYNISLPSASDDFQRKVSSLISTEEQKIRQFAYLIASGTFYSSTGSSGANFGDGMWTSLASSTLSSGLNAALGNILGDKWEIGTNLESSDGTLSNMDMSVSVSTKFLDDRLRLNTNLGYRTDNSAAVDNSFIGDFEAEYDLNSLWMLKAYNHTNDKFYRQAPTTQGVGISYTKEASSLKRLFQSFKRRRRANVNEQVQAGDSLQIKSDSLLLKTDSLPAVLPMDSVRTNATLDKE